MGVMTGAAMVTELQRRITNISANDALAAINRAIRWMNRQGSFTFQLATPTTLTPTADVGTLPNDMDDGKLRMFLNNNGTEIMKANVSDIDQSQNFNTPAAAGASTARYDTYFIQTVFASGVPASKVYFYPLLTPNQPTVTLIYHKITADIANSGSSWTTLPRDFDDLIIDIAEAAERRIYDVGDTWTLQLQMNQQEALKLLDGYKTLTIEPGEISESTAAVAEKTQLGRA
jgi:hypothetical protein